MSKAHRAKPVIHIILWASTLIILTALLWANYSILDEVTTGQGKVIPSSQIQIIQNLEGGVIKKIFVKKGDIVKKNQVLMQIGKTRFKSSYQEAQKKIDALHLEIIRLRAELMGVNPEFSDELKLNHPDLILNQQALYNSRMNQLNQLSINLNLAQKELDMTRPLLKNGSVSEVEVIRLERTVNDIQGTIDKFKSEELDKLNKASGILSALIEAQKADQDRVTRTTIRSPAYGIIKQIPNSTIGGIIQPGKTIIEIVPLDDTLLIEAKIRPSDIGFIHPGQRTIVKITAYDFFIYGGIEGVVEQISADTIIDETGKKNESYYIIKVRTASVARMQAQP
ncbi:HlyD family efflux transporter periplasmic adaptor subunit [Legionella sp. km535]|uniref:HlyD family efflux transporter periplasmic adaptor subunit n=1 Tax=Legionella sp. km535 TaxID=2498107 RepID=UPI000F8DAA7B|nr:HlyD family efflux transporter periplasmic adaptor subunit [Legionella sp. km535]RUR15313.1 HlyD family efflux transporter periplasmic adaptor subunit [Legionella sp. km535]